METDIGQYEVLQGENFSHMTEPMLSFAKKAVWINMGCMKHMPDTVYVHFLLFRQTRKLIVRQGIDDALDVIRWCTPSGKPRRILCTADFWNDLITLMEWDEHSRYRLLGRLVHGSGWDGIAFDMTRAEVFPMAGDGFGSPKDTMIMPVRSPKFQTWEDHRQNPLISRFLEDTSIPITEAEPK